MRLYRVRDSVIVALSDERAECICQGANPFVKCHLCRLDSYLGAMMSDLTITQYKAIHGTVFDFKAKTGKALFKQLVQ